MTAAPIRFDGIFVKFPAGPVEVWVAPVGSRVPLDMSDREDVRHAGYHLVGSFTSIPGTVFGIDVREFTWVDAWVDNSQVPL